MKQEMLELHEVQEGRDGVISQLKAMVQSLMGEAKGKDKAADPTPNASGAGGGNPPPPPRRRGAPGAPGGGGDPDDDGEGSGRRPDESRKGIEDERPEPQPEDDYDAKNDEQFNLFARVMANAFGQRTRVPAEPPALFKNKKYLDIRVWLLTGTDLFSRNCGQWSDKEQRIQYVLSRMEGMDVAPFVLTYRPQLTRELSYTTQEGYDFWHGFANRPCEALGPPMKRKDPYEKWDRFTILVISVSS